MGPEIGDYIARGLITLGIAIGVGAFVLLASIASGMWWLFQHVTFH